jgi:predicted nuclease with TOPRIM domain
MAAPVKQTCPDINKYIKYIKQAITEKRYLDRMNESDLLDAAETMSRELENCIDYLEELRKSNGALRDWGEGLEDELQNAATSISELEDKVEELKEELNFALTGTELPIKL